MVEGSWVGLGVHVTLGGGGGTRWGSGLVCQGSAWTLADDAWLRRQRFASRPLSLAFDECYGVVLQSNGRRDTLDRAIAELASSRRSRGSSAGLSACVASPR